MQPPSGSADPDTNHTLIAVLADWSALPGDEGRRLYAAWQGLNTSTPFGAWLVQERKLSPALCDRALLEARARQDRTRPPDTAALPAPAGPVSPSDLAGFETVSSPPEGPGTPTPPPPGILPWGRPPRGGAGRGGPDRGDDHDGGHRTSTRIARRPHECEYLDRALEQIQLDPEDEQHYDRKHRGCLRPQSFLGEGGPAEVGLARFTMCGCLGAGGFGAVYAAFQHELNTHRAFKLLPAWALEDPVRRDLLLAEVRTMALLSHPHVVTLYEAVEDLLPRRGLEQGAAGYTMELLSGTLRGKLQAPLQTHAPLPPREACRLLAQAAHGLAAVHVIGRVHQDIKPENLLQAADGGVKVADLGVALQVEAQRRAEQARDTTGAGPAAGPDTATYNADAAGPASILDAGDPAQAGAGRVAGAGSLPYMSPQQVDYPRQGLITAQSDVWNLGVTLHELLAGRRPFDPPQGTAPAMAKYKLAQAIVEARPAPLPADLPDRPLLAAMLARALAQSPERRYPSMTAFAEALEGYARDRTPRTARSCRRRPGPDSRRATGPGATASWPRPWRPPWPWSRPWP